MKDPRRSAITKSVDEMDLEKLRVIAQAARDYVMAGLCGNERADQRAKLEALIEVARDDR